VRVQRYTLKPPTLIPGPYHPSLIIRWRALNGAVQHQNACGQHSPRHPILNTLVETQRTPHAVNRHTGDFRQAPPCRRCATRTPQSPKTVDQTGQDLYHETLHLVTRGSEEASTGAILLLLFPKQHPLPILKCHVAESLQLQERLQFSRCRRSNLPGVKINRRATS